MVCTLLLEDSDLANDVNVGRFLFISNGKQKFNIPKATFLYTLRKTMFSHGKFGVTLLCDAFFFFTLGLRRTTSLTKICTTITTPLR